MPKTKEEPTENLEKDSVAVLDEQLFGDDISGLETSRGRSEAEDENFIHHEYSKFPSDYTSSSDLTQGTTPETGIVDDLQATFTCDEANSAANLCSGLRLDCPSNLPQVQ